MATDVDGNIRHHLNPVVGWLRSHVHGATGQDVLATEPGALSGMMVEMDAETLAAMARHLVAALNDIEGYSVSV